MEKLIKVIALLLFFNCKGQNLVPNGSFEIFNECPPNYHFASYQNCLKNTGWETTFVVSGCYFNADCDSSLVPSNRYGYQNARTGKGYVNLFFHPEGRYEPRPGVYFICKLKYPLNEGEKYSVGYYVSLAEISSHAISNFGIYLSEKRCYQNVNTSGGGGYIKENKQWVKPQFICPKDSFICDTSNWVHIGFEYTAKGGEEYLTIGNFYTSYNPYRQINKNHIKTGRYAYAAYYIDDVYVIPTDTINFNELKKGSIIILNQLYFSTDSFRILPYSYAQLNSMADYLNENPKLTILIEGHTDNTGDSTKNKTLSTNRANAVKKYLIQKGIQAQRITATGFGALYPIADNTTFEGKNKNRRVEISIK
jgi:outer membrane protein OmpA-like peptidoglycan-associated protein